MNGDQALRSPADEQSKIAQANYRALFGGAVAQDSESQ